MTKCLPPCAPNEATPLPKGASSGGLGTNCDNPLFVEVCAPDPILIPAEQCDGSTVDVDAQRVVVEGIVYTKECPTPKTDFEIVCASTDGRPIMAVIVIDAAGGVTSTLTEIDGSAIGDGATAVACPQSVDRERVEACMENGDGKWTVVSFVNADDPTYIVGPVFVNPNGAIVADPTDLVPCVDATTIQGLSEIEICVNGANAIKRTVINSDGVEVETFYGDDGALVTPPAAYTIGACPLDGRYEVHVVRLAGDATGSATARIEGVGFSGADVGNTYTIGTGGAFTDYVSYSAIWLGDSEQDAPLDWNGLSYRAGLGSGSAGYQHASLPSLSEVLGETHTDTIALTANAGAFIEFRFKVKV